MSTHTPGRLKVRGGFSIYADDGKTPVADTCLTNSVPDNDEANARRLAACWNACEGLDTESLEKHSLASVTSKLLKAKTQRDELATALSGLLSYFESGNSVPVDKATIKADSLEVIAARAAIQKVEGK